MADEKVNQKMWCGEENRMREVTLLGGFTCNLTPSEMNTWHKYVTELDIVQCYIKNALLMESILCRQKSTDVDLSEQLLTINERQQEYRKELFGLGSKWYAGLEAKIEPNP